MSRTHAMSRDAIRLNRPVLLAARFSTLLSLRRQRSRLARLDAKALADIGLTRDEAMTEAKRPIWDVPATWRY
ncbi:DUF1127 domain-containing protein [Alisedimentitalea sp. MJ-SS2]|uniref:DUF1127 domain-containing protein n=1 Tax=Aliisedimentitalea sp. MJ-SS2 TaxID=3049795 RepID=UPI00290CD88C|nr:DUF1127 domain-containing protein [Alisedimentitalea sp. MJ-SS2]MDU8929580.1 DUF1127 domain-containing protein [Alisedimentitalea sp. MJ-SS2]